MSIYDRITPSAASILSDQAEGSPESVAAQILDRVCLAIPLLARPGHADTGARLNELCLRLRRETEAWLLEGSGVTGQQMSSGAVGEGCTQSGKSGHWHASLRLEIGRQ